MAAKTNRRKSKATNYPVPETRDEANDMIAEIGRNNRELTRLEASMNDEMAVIKERFEKCADPIRDRSEALHAGVQIFCEANRKRLTNGGAVKHHKFPSGEVNWRNRPPSTKIKGGNDAVISYCRTNKLERFVQENPKVDREALRKEPDVARSIPGVSIGSEGEDFIIEPHEAELDQTG